MGDGLFISAQLCTLEELHRVHLLKCAHAFMLTFSFYIFVNNSWKYYIIYTLRLRIYKSAINPPVSDTKSQILNIDLPDLLYLFCVVSNASCSKYKKRGIYSGKCSVCLV